MRSRLARPQCTVPAIHIVSKGKMVDGLATLPGRATWPDTTSASGRPFLPIGVAFRLLRCGCQLIEM